MTFTDKEYSKRESYAIYLYHFSDGTDEWFYCSGTENAFTFDGDSYTPALINHNPIRYSQNPYDDKLEINCGTNLGIVKDNIGRFQSPKIYLNLYKIQNNDPTLYKRLWYGYISDFVYNDATTKIMVNSIMAALSKRVVKKVHSSLCQHQLYDAGCGLSAASYKHAGTITGITDGTQIGAVVFNTGTPNTYLSSKMITSDGEERIIISDPGTGIVEILRPFKDAIVTTTFDVYDKCDRTFTGSCTSFGNTDNFFGNPYMKNNPLESIIEDSGAINTNPLSET